MHNPCALGKTSTIVFGKWQWVNIEIFCAIDFGMRKQKLAVNLRAILFHVQSILYLHLAWGPWSAVEQVQVSTDWRIASLSSRRKPDQSVILVPGHWHCQPHYTVFHPLVRALFFLPLPHLSASNRVWREFQYWSNSLYLYLFLLWGTKSILKESKGHLLCWISGLQLTQIL